jgi:hypothetical protein
LMQNHRQPGQASLQQLPTEKKSHRRIALIL